jgi:RNA polymerase sigma-70 factor (ECF subfamily)
MAYPFDDKEIIRQFRQGGNKANLAFKSIVLEYGPKLYAQIRTMTRSHELTNDVLQNVFIKVFENLHVFIGDSTLYTWMYRIARNETLNFLEKERRRQGVDIDPPMLEIISGYSSLSSIGEEEIFELLQRAISTLPEKQALVFELRYFQEMSYQEISRKTDTSVGALKANFHHAKQKIEEYLLNQLNL